MGGYQTVVVGTDGSETSVPRRRRARPNSPRDAGATLVIACAYFPRRKDTAPTGRPGRTRPTRSSARPRPRTPCSGARDRATPPVRRKIETKAVQGKPADTLRKVAAECNADLLVVGNRRAEHPRRAHHRLGAAGRRAARADRRARRPHHLSRGRRRVAAGRRVSSTSAACSTAVEKTLLERRAQVHPRRRRRERRPAAGRHPLSCGARSASPRVDDDESVFTDGDLAALKNVQAARLDRRSIDED